MDEGLEMHPAVLGHYATGVERDRLSVQAHNRLEFERTKVVLREALPAGGLVYDIGGGPGVYATWLSDLGYDVELFDVVPLHVDQARAASERCARPFTVDLADARAVPRPDATADVVLLLGPLYHLVDAAQRRRALAEARRVLKTGGLLVAAGIGRLAWLLDATKHNLIVDPLVRDTVRYSVRTGISHWAPAPGAFYGYFHRPAELLAEVREAGFPAAELIAVEGFGYVLGDLGERLDDDTDRAALFEMLHDVQADEGSLTISPHLLAVATRA
jgi:SAM-dependent methyltransferase